MNGKTIQLKLESMKDKRFEYASAVHTVQSYVISDADETFELKTNLNSFKRKYESAQKFFDFWLEIKGPVVVQKVKELSQQSDLVPVFEKENHLADKLVDILMSNIEKVKANQAYIPQAKAINNDVNSILHVQRLKLDMVKHMKGKI